MKLEFSWSTGPAGPQATCTSSELASHGVSPLACLLMDDGGLDRSMSLAWLQKGIFRVDAILSGIKEGRSDWLREAWGAAVTVAETNVYSLHDERCAEAMPTSNFRQALVEWKRFLETESGSNTVVIELI